MAFTTAELAYLTSQRHARLATLAPDGAPRNKPVGFHHNAELGTLDIYGIGMESSAKFRNVRTRPEVSLVVDDVAGAGPSAARFLEIRGRAETALLAEPPAPHLSAHIIRVRPRRIIGYNIDPDQPGLHTRDVPTSPAGR